MALGSLVVEIIGDASNLKRELSDAANSSDTFATKARAGLNAVGVALGAMGAAAGAAMGALVVSGMASAKEIKNLAALANTSAEDFQAFAYAARSVGIEQDKLGDILKDVNDKVGDFMTTGAGPLADFFERVGPRVGVTAEQFRNLSGPQALGLYVDSLNRANLSQAELTFFMEAIASDSTALLPLLKDNAAGLNAMAKEAQSLGVITSSIDIAKIEAARASLATSATVSDAFARSMATEAAPVISVIAEGLKDWAIQMGGFDKVARNTIDGIATGAGFVGDVFRGWSLIIQANITLLRTLFAEATRGLDYLAKGTEGWRRDFWESVDGLGERLGIELDLSGAADQAGKNFSEFSAAAVTAANQSIDGLRALLAEPLPSDQLDARLQNWRDKAEAAAAALVKQKDAAKATSTAAPTGSRFTVNESDAGIEEIRSRLAERSATFEAWRLTQLNESGKFEQSQLELYKQFEKARDEALKAAHDREDAILKDRASKGLIDKKTAGEMALQLDKDQAAQLIEARAASAAELAAILGNQPPVDPLGAEGGATVDEIRARLQGQVDTIAEFNALRLEQLQSQQDQELAILQARRDADLLSAAEFEALKAGIEKEGADARKQTAEAERAAKVGIYGSMFDNVAALMQTGSKKLFNIGKIASVSAGLVSAYESVMHAYKEGTKIGGPIVGAAYAATAGIAQAANLMRLKSASFGGGGSVSTSGGGGGSTPTTGAGGGGVPGEGGTNAAPQLRPTVAISLAGSMFSADTVRELLTQINEQIADGATIKVT